ncbi:restriction endonuclease subunit S [Dokdonia sp. Asnod1-B02]|uniref:restriction endonuclease subunit S n=1 Tax=Dokdonia sp. Asnod1-B02 TaxID=3160573 RepID=UPI00386328DA
MKNIKTYSTYKNSEVVWLGKVPENWKIIKSKRILIETSIKGFPDEELLAATQTKGVVPKSVYGKTTVTATKNFETLKLVEKGDFVISLRSFQGGIEYAHYRGIISPAYTILKPQEEVVHKYFRYLLKSKRYISGLTLLVTGIREGQNIDTGKFKDSYLPLPPKPEQTAIANFLDYKLEKIERFIKKKKQLIELLIEQKAAIINQAVTKGLNPNVNLKPSGIEWLGDIPEHWEVRNTFEYFKNRKIKNIGLINNNRLSLSHGKIVTKSILDGNGLVPDSYETYQIVEPGNIIFRFTDLQNDKKSLRTGLVYDFGIITSAYVAIETTKTNCNSKYFHLLFHSYDLSKAFYNLGGGVRQSMSFADLKKIKICCPSVIEQEQIVIYIETETTKIDKTISTIEKEIALVEEYKTTLISEAVTGKIDVRDFKIPEVETPLAMVAEDATAYNIKE